MADQIYVHTNLITEGSLNPARGSVNNALKRAGALALSGSIDSVNYARYNCNGMSLKLFSNSTCSNVEYAYGKIENVKEVLEQLAVILKTGPDDLAEIDHNCKNKLTTWSQRVAYNVKSIPRYSITPKEMIHMLFGGLYAKAVKLDAEINDSGDVFLWLIDKRKEVRKKWDNMEGTAKGYFDHVPIIDKGAEILIGKGKKKVSKSFKLSNKSILFSKKLDDDFEDTMKSISYFNNKAKEQEKKGNYVGQLGYQSLGLAIGICGACVMAGDVLISDKTKQLMRYSDELKQEAAEQFNDHNYLEFAKDLGVSLGTGLLSIGYESSVDSAKILIEMGYGKVIVGPTAHLTKDGKIGGLKVSTIMSKGFDKLMKGAEGITEQVIDDLRENQDLKKGVIG